MESYELWIKKAEKALRRSLHPQPNELNTLDWKVTLSTNKNRISEHLSAFSNLEEGGFLVFGINKDAIPIGLKSEEIKEITERLGSLARQSLEPAIQIDHQCAEIEGKSILFIHIPSSKQKPVHIRGKSIEHSFIRSAGQTRKMTALELRTAITSSDSIPFERQTCGSSFKEKDFPQNLYIEPYFQLLKLSMPKTLLNIIDIFCKEGFISQEDNTYKVTNLGALLFGRDISKYNHLSRKVPRVIVYAGKNKTKVVREKEGKVGYAVGFENLVNFVFSQLPEHEKLDGAFRQAETLFPQMVLREIIANSLVHQDLEQTGSGPMIEIFSDRIEVTNPGRSLVDPLRMLDAPPQARNEILGKSMRRLGICEERGSGIDRVVAGLELSGLPAPKFSRTESGTQVILFGSRALTRIPKQERINSCYLHAVKQHIMEQEPMTNKSVRKRFGIAEDKSSQATKIINETLESELVKPLDPENSSRKFSKYVPFWAE